MGRDVTPAAWSVYMLRCADGSLYTGIATDVGRRLAQHSAGTGAKYVRGRGPLELVASAELADRAEAQRIEAKIKRLPRERKQSLATSPRQFHAWLAQARLNP